MHKCSKCGRAASSLEEIDAGCPCGSKVFVFDRQIATAVAAMGEAEGNGGADGGNGAMAAGTASEGNSGAGAAGDAGWPGIPGNGGNDPAANTGAASTFAVPKAAKGYVQETQEGQDGKVPESYFARTSFTNDDIENIKVLTQGVFILDVNAISKNPVVLKDEDEIYYVKLPLIQKKAPAPDGVNAGSGKEKK